MSNPEALKPCPFCGYDIVKMNGVFVHDTNVWVCPIVNAKITNTEHWNTRPIETKLREENERLKFFVKIRTESLNEWQETALNRKAKLEVSQARLEKARAALNFYASTGDESAKRYSTYCIDSGDKARQALKDTDDTQN